MGTERLPEIQDSYLIEAARFLATNSDARTENIAICAEFAVADSEALGLAEQGDAEPETWWK